MKLTPSLRLLSVLLLTVGLAVAGGFAAPTDAQQTTYDCSLFPGQDCSLFQPYCAGDPNAQFTILGPCDDGEGSLAFLACGRDFFICTTS